ncbi:hypothetical protein DFA_05559 [Cavenderia fasciculata]|uniref:Uncharacterized protein n=1 Tax=Cavenderia fasciculata TaxID=261658 RepID=F4PLK5_CACFS|nr:uncharacterized protein DFA_05559 [Cavenderia fasciculata]EGG23427.1 hypothetical protein DFA_05559 [Cavenderia fasciculata]|eukprot:XP_004361278.1 hypothetical protein DFA_05559 [Cavenderia fasciculata]
MNVRFTTPRELLRDAKTITIGQFDQHSSEWIISQRQSDTFTIGLYKVILQKTNGTPFIKIFDLALRTGNHQCLILMIETARDSGYKHLIEQWSVLIYSNINQQCLDVVLEYYQLLTRANYAQLIGFMVLNGRSDQAITLLGTLEMRPISAPGLTNLTLTNDGQEENRSVHLIDLAKMLIRKRGSSDLSFIIQLCGQNEIDDLLELIATQVTTLSLKRVGGWGIERYFGYKYLERFETMVGDRYLSNESLLFGAGNIGFLRYYVDRKLWTKFESIKDAQVLEYAIQHENGEECVRYILEHLPNPKLFLRYNVFAIRPSTVSLLFVQFICLHPHVHLEPDDFIRDIAFSKKYDALQWILSPTSIRLFDDKTVNLGAAFSEAVYYDDITALEILSTALIQQNQKVGVHLSQFHQMSKENQKRAASIIPPGLLDIYIEEDLAAMRETLLLLVQHGHVSSGGSIGYPFDAFGMLTDTYIQKYHGQGMEGDPFFLSLASIDTLEFVSRNTDQNLDRLAYYSGRTDIKSSGGFTANDWQECDSIHCCKALQFMWENSPDSVRSNHYSMSLFLNNHIVDTSDRGIKVTLHFVRLYQHFATQPTKINRCHPLLTHSHLVYQIIQLFQQQSTNNSTFTTCNSELLDLLAFHDGLIN